MISWSISMNLYHTGLSELYREIEALGDPLTGISDRIDFERIRPILSDLYDNNTDKGGNSFLNKLINVLYCRFDPVGKLLLIYSPVPFLARMITPVLLSEDAVDLFKRLPDVITPDHMETD
jgi:hypothetical protein